jgi:HD-like signal output (HDOD) protein
MPENNNQNVHLEISEGFLKRLNTIRNLPTLPVIIQKLGKEVRNPRSDAKKVARIIEDDPAMMARILKVVNSAFYAGVEPVTSIQLAVARIGMTAVGNIAMSTAVFSAFGKAGATDFDRKEFWRHSICTGIAAGVLYDRVRSAIPSRFTKDVLHLAGLLHDIGKIVFDQYFHAEFMEAIKNGQAEQVSLLDSETKVIGEGHNRVGAWLGWKWNLTEDLQQVIRFHHDPDASDEKHWYLTGLVHTANYICNLEKIGYSGDQTPQFAQNVWKKFGLAVGDIPDVVDKVNEESKKSEILMTIAQGV